MNIATKKYIDQELKHYSCKIEVLLKKEKEASIEARRLMEYRLDHMNQLREQLTRNEKTFLSKSEYDLKHENILSKHDGLAKIVYIGLGIVAAIQCLVGAFLIHISK